MTVALHILLVYDFNVFRDNSGLAWSIGGDLIVADYHRIRLVTLPDVVVFNNIFQIE